MDFSKFHRIETDEKSTTLRHPSGHLIKIAHKGLSPEYKKELDQVPMKMAKGGKVNYEQFQKNIKASPPSKPSESSNTMPGSPKMASMAYTEPQDGGTDVVLSALHREAPPFGPLGAEEKQHYPPCINPSCKSYGKSHPNCKCYGGVSEHTGAGEAGMFAEGGAVEKENYCDANRMHFKGCEYYKGEEPQKLAEGTPDDTVQPDPSSMPVETPQYENPAPAPQPEQGQQFGPTDTVAPDMAPADRAQATTAALHDESMKLQNDLNNGHIKPETYRDLYAKKDTLGKIGTVFGMLVGGMGSGLTHQPNALMSMMDNEISRDLDAQKTSASNRQNFMTIAQHGLMNQANVTGQNLANETNSRALAWSAAARSALHQQIQNAQNMPQGPARQQAMQALAVLSQGIDRKEADMFSQAGLAQAITESAGKGGGNTQFMKSGLMGAPFQRIGEDIEQKTIDNVPSVSGQQATRPIPQDKRDQVQNMNVLDEKAKDLINYAKAHEGSWNPKTRAIAQQKANEMVGFYSSSLGTSMTEGNRTWLDEQIAKKNPTSAISQELYGSNAKLNEIMNSNAMRRNNLLKSVGLHPKEEAQTKTMNGAQYKKVNGGWQRVK